MIDDDEDIRVTLGEILERMAYGVTVAADGLDALSQLRAGNRPSVILLDLMMPVMDGFEFLLEIRKDRALAAIPVVVITAAGNAKVEAAKVSASGHIQKPFKADELLETLDRVLQRA